MTEHLIKYYLDGTPGIILQGARGIMGNRGVQTYTNFSKDTVDEYSKFDLWLTNSNKVMPEAITITNDTIDMDPITNDYLLFVQSGITYLYKIDYCIKNSVLTHITKDKYPELTDEYISILNNYYSDPKHTTTDNDVWTAILIDKWKQYTNDVSVITNIKTIPYTAWNGKIKKMDDNKIIAETEIDSINLITFDTISTTNKNLGNIKITAEFTLNDLNGKLRSEIIKYIWCTDKESTSLDNYPYGLDENIQYTLNYDNEILGNFEVVIKDWTDAVNSMSFTNSAYFKCENFKDYTILIYVYSYINNMISKTYIGEIPINTLISNI
jgi:hypothetical protein